MVKKKLIIMLLALICTVTLAVGGTVAYLVTLAGPVTNTFTYGDISLKLEETTGSSYKLIPGSVIKKDPRITVVSGSEDCYLFVKVVKGGSPDLYLNYAMADGWLPLFGYDGVYYRTVEGITEDAVFHVLNGDAMTVKDTLTKDQMKTITEKPRLSFTAYAVQSYGIDSAAAAYGAILAEE